MADVELEDDEEAEVGTMRISEIKSELKLRNVDFSDCFDRESLAQKLREARESGKADPSIIDQFNKQRVRAYLNFRNAMLYFPHNDLDNILVVGRYV